MKHLAPVTLSQKRLILIESNIDALDVFDLCMESINESTHNVDIINESLYEVRKYFKEGIDKMVQKINEMVDQIFLLFDRLISNNRFIMKEHKDLIIALSKSPKAGLSDARLKIYDLRLFNSVPHKVDVENYRLSLNDTTIDEYIRTSRSLELVYADSVNKLIIEMYDSLIPLSTVQIRYFNMEKFKNDIHERTFKSENQPISSENVIDCLDFMNDFVELRKQIKKQRNDCVSALYRLRDNVEESINILDAQKLKAISRKSLSDPQIRFTKDYANLVNSLEDYYTILANIVYQSHTIKFRGYLTILNDYKENINILVRETRTLYNAKDIEEKKKERP